MLVSCKEQTNSCYIVMYHYVRDLKHNRYPQIKGLDIELFKKQLDFLQSNFNIIKMEQLLSSVMFGEPLPPKAALLTFDDGYSDHYENVFPEIYLRGLQGCFFVPAAVVAERRVLDVNKIHYILASADEDSILKEVFILLDEFRKSGSVTETNQELRNQLQLKSRYDTPGTVLIKALLQYGLDYPIRINITDKLFKKFVSCDERAFAAELYISHNQVMLMKECGMFFGLHGYDHFWLGKADPITMKNDINHGLDYWNGIVDKDCWVMNYPYGSCNGEVVSFIRSAGCKVGLGTRAAVANLNEDDIFELPRLDTNDFPPKSKKYRELGGVRCGDRTLQ